MLQHAWTASSLAAGFIPMKCLGVVLLVFIARILVGRMLVPAKA
jgi:hypothetical protein